MEYNNLSDYDYYLPEELIAQEPLRNRDSSRMMVLHRANGLIENTLFSKLPSYLQAGDILVLNNTRVIPARLIGKISGKDLPAEILLLREEYKDTWVCMVKPGKKLKPGASVDFDFGVTANVTGYAEEGLRLIKFQSSEPFKEVLPRLGKVPLPPYIKKDVEDPNQYQTIYARENGSAAAPTAGFHFTKQTFDQLKEIGVKWTYITLHIGPGTFQPVKADDIREHVMHREYYRIDAETAASLNAVRKKGGRIIAVGTTACRVLESVADEGGLFYASDDWTGLYIYPGYRFKAVDAMLTNFHLPRSSLLMLVSALAGHKLIMKAYRQAVNERYRFFSFGDCMLIL